MPRYFFHLYNSIEVHDDEGTKLANADAARAHAIAEARQLMADELKTNGELNLSHRIEVEDDRREAVLILKFGDAVKVTP